MNETPGKTPLADNNRPRITRFQFSLRTVFLEMIVASLIFAWWAKVVREREDDRKFDSLLDELDSVWHVSEAAGDNSGRVSNTYYERRRQRSHPNCVIEFYQLREKK